MKGCGSLAERARPQRNEPLASYTTLGVGGPAHWFIRAERADDVAKAHEWCASEGLALFVLGGGSNIVVADNGVAGLVMHMAMDGMAFEPAASDTLVRAGAGESWDRVVAAVVQRGLGGIECLSGIPGTAGGTPVQNVGAYGQEVGETIEHVTAFDRRGQGLVTLPAAACGFSYRTSRFKTDDAGRFIVCGVTLRLRPAAPAVAYPDLSAVLQARGVADPTLAQVRDAVLAIRRRKGMVLDDADPDTRSVGSFFMNPSVTQGDRERISASAGAPAPGFPLADGRVKVPAAWLIERAGFRKGDGEGAVGISTKHPLALVNRGGATAADIVRFAIRIKRRVIDRFGLSLRPEPVFVGFESDPDVEYLKE
jgi:UDP-N-acetylmuramate dehydrogenase